MQSAKSSFDVDLKIPLHLNKRSECSADPRSSWTNYSVSNSPVTSKWVTITKPGYKYVQVDGGHHDVELQRSRITNMESNP